METPCAPLLDCFVNKVKVMIERISCAVDKGKWVEDFLGFDHYPDCPQGDDLPEGKYKDDLFKTVSMNISVEVDV